MTGLHEQLGAVVEADAARFKGDVFAEQRGQSIRARVRGRRALRTTALSGGGALAVGAIALAGAKVPWQNWAMPGAAGDPQVVVPTDQGEPLSPEVRSQIDTMLAEGASPLQCGFVFAAPSYGIEEVLTVTSRETTTQEVYAIFDDWYGQQAPTTDVLGLDTRAFIAELNPEANMMVRDGYEASVLDVDDPRRVYPLGAERDADDPEGVFALSYVLVSDATVVGVVSPHGGGETPGLVMDRDGRDPETAFLWNLDSFTGCGGAIPAQVELYAVTGYGTDRYRLYAWDRVD